MNQKVTNKWIMYWEIHKLQFTGMTPPQIASRLGIDPRTVKSLLGMSEKDYENHQLKQMHRCKKLAQYEDFVKKRIGDCLQASSAQVHDWLKECHPDFPKTSPKTVYNFTIYVRNLYGLPKVFSTRPYHMVEELPYGKQMQADMGEYNMTDVDGARKKVWFCAFVLSRSRYKFVTFREHPFTTNELIQAHEDAFAFIDGYPEEMVYDQDKLLLVSENHGDLILTEAFHAYQQSRPFRLHFCRKSDPQSKGKVESVVKYVKYNFLRGRIYYDIHTLNQQALEWLGRTANAKEHATTCKVPAQEWLQELISLIPLKLTFVMKQEKTRYGVRKDNTLRYKCSSYTLPEGTYEGHGTSVFVLEDQGMLSIWDSKHVLIATHRVSLLKGELVRNSNHYRDTAKKINELMDQVCLLFSDTQQARLYLEQVRQDAPRYARDQLRLIANIAKRYPKAEMDRTLLACIQDEIFRATDFEPVLLSLKEQDVAIPEKCHAPMEKHRKDYRIIPQTSNITDYKQILE
jgi:hypothetical protein